jgi:hypothetical protein
MAERGLAVHYACVGHADHGVGAGRAPGERDVRRAGGRTSTCQPARASFDGYLRLTRR